MLPKKVLLALVVFAFSRQAIGADTSIFTQHNIVVPFNVTHPITPANILPQQGVELLVLGVDKDNSRVMGIYGLDSQTGNFELLDMITISKRIFAYDVGEAQADGLQYLYFLDKNSLLKYLPTAMSRPSPLIIEQALSSMYLADVADVISYRDFVQDRNGDGKDDILLPHFEHFNLWLSDCCGQRQLQSLPIGAHLQTDDGSVTFEDLELFYTDMTQDDKADVVLVETGKLSVFSQNKARQFSQVPFQVAINPSLHGLNWWDIRDVDGQRLDQSQLSHRKVEVVEDLNGDNIPDIVVRHTKSTGVLDKINDYEFYFGKLSDGQLSYAQEPNSTITSEDTLSDLQLFDLNDDGKQEVMLSSYDLGISQIIGALLSGSIDQEVLLFSMGEQGQYASKPMVSQEMEITFSLSSGRRGEPMMKVADMNGDKVKDLVFSDGEDSIKVLLATPKGKRAYAKRAKKQKIQVPKNAKDIAQYDINGDQKPDLILHYGRYDDPQMLNQVKVLIVN